MLQCYRLDIPFFTKGSFPFSSNIKKEVALKKMYIQELNTKIALVGVELGGE